MRKLILTLLFLSITTSAHAVADKYKINPFTSKMDNIGNFYVVDTQSSCMSRDYCWVYEDDLLKLYVNNIFQEQWPSVAIDKLLLEDGGFMLLESGDKVLLE